MHYRSLFSALLCLFVVAMPVLAGAGAKDDGPPEPRLLPWKLRDHYTMTPEGFEFIYGGDNGQWSLGKGDTLLMDAQGRSSISMEDFAVAILDEIENPKYVNNCFTAGY